VPQSALALLAAQSAFLARTKVRLASNAVDALAQPSRLWLLRDFSAVWRLTPATLVGMPRLAPQSALVLLAPQAFRGPR
jgi:hypothetical protein